MLLKKQKEHKINPIAFEYCFSNKIGGEQNFLKRDLIGKRKISDPNRELMFKDHNSSYVLLRLSCSYLLQ